MELFPGIKQNRISHRILNKSGQFAIEAVLLMFVLAAMFLAVKNKLQERQVLQNLTNKSVGSLKKMTEYGTWKDECRSKAGGGATAYTLAACHPNSMHRAISSNPQN